MQDDNSTCPEYCTCDRTALSCYQLSKLPYIDEIAPYTFTKFMFYDCNLETLPGLPASYANATDLLVINSGLSTIDENAFQLLDKLETLELSGNAIKVVSRNLLSPLKKLIKLDLSSNKLQELPDGVFNDLSGLSELHLDGNWLKFGESLFEGADKLEKLTCNNCHLTSIPAKSLKRIKNLKHLELNQNPFQRLEKEAFVDLKADNHPLFQLSLNNCSLDNVEKTSLWPFKTLRHLDLAHNKLKSLQVGTFKAFWKSLKILYLENNQLQVVEERLAPWSNLEEIKLGNNMWTCNCDMAWIKSIELDKIDKENVTCESPSALQGHDLHEVATEMNCPDRRYFLILGFGIPAVTVVLVGAICCVVKFSGRSRLGRGESIKYRPVRDSTGSKQFLVL